MKTCTVCGNKVQNIGGHIIRGKSKEWVCRECLKKANVSVMQFGFQNITPGQIMARINGNEIIDNHTQASEPQDIPQENFAQTQDAVVEQNNAGGLRCPRCKSTEMQIISDVEGKGASFTKICLCGICGLAGAGKTTTTHYWVCKKCGNKFKM